jgi:hypothetical protein
VPGLCRGGAAFVSRFVTAPTERFLRRIEELRSLPAEMRQHIAARAADEIRQAVGSGAAEAVQELRQRAQDQRWRLISQGIDAERHECFGAVMLSEQWAVAKLAMTNDTSPIGQILGERRLRAIEAFLQDNLPGGVAPMDGIVATDGVVATQGVAATEDADREAAPWGGQRRMMGSATR